MTPFESTTRAKLYTNIFYGLRLAKDTPHEELGKLADALLNEIWKSSRLSEAISLLEKAHDIINHRLASPPSPDKIASWANQFKRLMED